VSYIYGIIIWYLYYTAVQHRYGIVLERGRREWGEDIYTLHEL